MESTNNMSGQGHTDRRKIAIIGIENAGKTSIIKVLTREFDLLINLKPTIGVERTFLEFFGKNLVIWDYGGQETFRKKYFRTPERYFDGIAFLFYVLDIQDPTLLGSNIMYFQGLYRKLQKYSPNAEIIFLFHKLDPQLSITQVTDKLRNEFLDAVMYQLEDDSKSVRMYNTSIYNPPSVVKAISEPLFGNKEITHHVGRILQSFCEAHHLLFVSLLTESFFEIGFFATDRFQLQYSKQLNEIFQTFYRNFEKWRDPELGLPSKIGEVDLSSCIFLIEKEGKKTPYFLAIGYDEDKNLPKVHLEASIENLKENLSKILINIDVSQILQIPTK